MKQIIYLFILIIFLSNCALVNKFKKQAEERAENELNKKLEEADKKLDKEKERSTDKLADEKPSVVNTVKEPEIVVNTPEIWNLSGWAVSPKEIVEKKITSLETAWYYTKIQSKASERAIKLKSPSYLEFTCKNSAKRDKDTILDSMLTNLVGSPSKEELSKLKEKVNISNTEPQVITCKSEGAELQYSSCECMVATYFAGGKEGLKKSINP